MKFFAFKQLIFFFLPLNQDVFLKKYLFNNFIIKFPSYIYFSDITQDFFYFKTIYKTNDGFFLLLFRN